MPAAFHDIRFPLSVALGGSGGPTRKTEIISMGSGREERIARWSRSLRVYDAGSGVKTLGDLNQVLAFFEERRGRLYGFRWRDRADYSSANFGSQIAPTDQMIGTGDGQTLSFQLIKLYGGNFAPYRRVIDKPVAGTVRVAVNGIEKILGTHWTVDSTTGLIRFAASSIPAIGASVTAGFEFDVPVRFASDDISIDYAAFTAGEIPKIPLIEIIP